MARRGKKEGTIGFHEPSGRWYARITVGYDAEGKQKRRTVYGVTREETAAKLTELMAKQSQGLLAEPSRFTVSEWLDKWLAAKTHLSSKTRSSYRFEVSYIRRGLGEVRVQKLKPAQIRDFYTSLADVTGGNLKVSPRTQRKVALHLKSALKEAVELEIITRNPAEAVKLKAPRVEPKAEAWTREEAATFLGAAKGDPLYAVFYLMLALGLRRGEALGLRWRDVDLGQGLLSIRQSLSLTGEGGPAVLKEVKTPRSRRTLYLARDAIAVLEAHKVRQDGARAYLGEGWQETGLVFTTSLGTPIQPDNISRSFKRLCKAAGVRQVRVHDLRHTYATLSLRNGVPVEVVSERLGHASVGFTLDVYRHLYEAERKEAALNLETLLGTGQDARPVN